MRHGIDGLVLGVGRPARVRRFGDRVKDFLEEARPAEVTKGLLADSGSTSSGLGNCPSGSPFSSIGAPRLETGDRH